MDPSSDPSAPRPGHRPALGQHYAFVVAAVIFLCLLLAAARQSVPAVLMTPLEDAFHWSRSSISLAAAVSIFFYGMVGPFAGAAMERFGIRRVLITGLLVLTASNVLSAFVTRPWQLVAIWGLLAGPASGSLALVLGATVVNRWFTTHRGLMMGLLTASTATGNLVFLPVLATLAESGDWRRVVWAVAAAGIVLLPIVLLVVRDRPADVGLLPYGSEPGTAPPAKPAAAGFLENTLGVLRRAARRPVFWALFATFFICGFTTNGLVGTHLISLCGDHGVNEVRAAGLLATMGIFDLIGTTASGWLTDRFDPRKLLFAYYFLRGVALIYLPHSDFSLYGLAIFAVFFGLDWIATVPPTLRLTTEAFGDRDAGIVFGWVVAGHQLGAACAAWMGGFVRETYGNYMLAFVLAGATGIAAAFVALLIDRRPAVAVGQPA